MHSTVYALGIQGAVARLARKNVLLLGAVYLDAPIIAESRDNWQQRAEEKNRRRRSTKVMSVRDGYLGGIPIDVHYR
jgi:type III secretory pathway component EscR